MKVRPAARPRLETETVDNKNMHFTLANIEFSIVFARASPLSTAHRCRAHGDDAGVDRDVFWHGRLPPGRYPRRVRIVPRAFCARPASRFSPAQTCRADVQRDKTDFHAAVANFIQQ